MCDRILQLKIYYKKYVIIKFDFEKILEEIAYYNKTESK